MGSGTGHLVLLRREEPHGQHRIEHGRGQSRRSGHCRPEDSFRGCGRLLTECWLRGEQHLLLLIRWPSVLMSAPACGKGTGFGTFLVTVFLDSRSRDTLEWILLVSFGGHSPLSTPPPMFLLSWAQVFGLQKNVLWPGREGAVSPHFTRGGLGLMGPRVLPLARQQQQAVRTCEWSWKTECPKAGPQDGSVPTPPFLLFQPHPWV